MVANLQLSKPLKRYLRQTWLYPVKNWLQRHSPAGVRHHQQFLAFYAQFIKPGDLCFDVGANIGNRTEVFVELGAKTVCCEPQAVCLQRLHQLFGNNPNVIMVEKAIGDYEGTAELSICEDASTISTLSTHWKTNGRFAHKFEWNKTQSVPITTLDRLIAEYGLPKFCKIDVEGFELSVLKGLTQPIPVISFELNIELIDDMAQCIRHLQSIAAVEFNYSLAESMEFACPHWLSGDELLATLSATNNQELWGDIYAKLNARAK
jgi:FkbM family methyltransferase